MDVMGDFRYGVPRRVLYIIKADERGKSHDLRRQPSYVQEKFAANASARDTVIAKEPDGSSMLYMPGEAWDNPIAVPSIDGAIAMIKLVGDTDG